MDILSSRQEQTLLFDFYGEMLTPRQRDVFVMSTMDDCSFAEIASELSITPQGVADALKRAKEQLDKYEKTFELVSKYNAQKSVIAEIETKLTKLDAMNWTEISECVGAIRASLAKL